MWAAGPRLHNVTPKVLSRTRTQNGAAAANEKNSVGFGNPRHDRCERVVHRSVADAAEVAREALGIALPPGELQPPCRIEIEAERSESGSELSIEREDAILQGRGAPATQAVRWRSVDAPRSPSSGSTYLLCGPRVGSASMSSLISLTYFSMLAMQSLTEYQGVTRMSPEMEQSEGIWLTLLPG